MIYICIQIIFFSFLFSFDADDWNYIKKTGGVNIVVSSWTLDNLSEISKEIQNMISLLGGKSTIV